MAKKFPLEIVIAATDKASAVLNRVADRVDRFNAPFLRLRKAFGALADKTGLAGVGDALKSVGASALDIGRKIAVGMTAAAVALAAFTYQQAMAADEIGDTAARLHIGTTALQAWRFGFEQADVSQQAFISSLDTLNQSLGLAKLGMGKALPLFRGLALDPRKFKTVEELLPALADRLSRISDPVKRAAIANKLLGEAGADMALKLAQGPKALQEMEVAARAAGAVIDGSVIESAGVLDSRLKALRATLSGVAGNVLGRLYPALIKIAEAVQAAVVRYQPQIAAFADQFGAKLPGYIDQTVHAFSALVGIAKKVAAAIAWCNDTFGTTATTVGLFGITIGRNLTLALARLSAALVRVGVSFAVAFPIPALIIAGVAAAVAAGWWLYKNWDKVSMAIGDTVDWIVGKFRAAWDLVKSTAVAAFKAVAEVLEAVFKSSPLFLAFKGMQWLAGKVFGAGAAPAANAPAVGASLLTPGAQSKQQVSVKVDLSNLPPGTRATAQASNGILFDLSRGWAMPGVP